MKRDDFGTWFKKVYFAVILVGMLAMVGCGGGGGDSAAGNSPATPQTATGIFVDAPVAGMKYISGSQSGTTDVNGSFTYEVGQMVKFMVGDIVIGESNGSSVITPVDLVKYVKPGQTVGATDPMVTNITKFLITVSGGDTSAATLTIPSAVVTAAAGKTIDFSNAAQLQTVVGQLTTTPLVSDASAQTHLQTKLSNLNVQSAGKYVLKNSDTIMLLDSDGTGKVIGTWKNIYGETRAIAGTIDAAGNVSITTIVNGQTHTIEGSIDSNGNITIAVVGDTNPFTGFKVAAIDAKYTGTYEMPVGSDSAVELKVAADGSLAGTAVNIYGNTFAISGYVNTSGSFIAQATGAALTGIGVVSGSFDGNGKATATFVSWENNRVATYSSTSGVRTTSPYAGIYTGTGSGTLTQPLLNGPVTFIWKIGVDAAGKAIGYATVTPPGPGAPPPGGTVTAALVGTVNMITGAVTLLLYDLNSTNSGYMQPAQTSFQGQIANGSVSGTWVGIPSTDGSGTWTGAGGSSSNAVSLIGSWGGQDADKTVIINFLDSSNYVFSQQATAGGGGQSGIEVGTYTWNPATGAFSTTITGPDTNGSWGFSNPSPTSVVVSGNTMTVTYPGEAPRTANRIVRSPNTLIGGWRGQGADIGAVITFIDNSNYIHSQYGSPAGGGYTGIEVGTYTWDPTTGAFTSSVTRVDTNGTWGLSGPPPPNPTVTVSGNTMTFISPLHILNLIGNM